MDYAHCAMQFGVRKMKTRVFVRHTCRRVAAVAHVAVVAHVVVVAYVVVVAVCCCCCCRVAAAAVAVLLLLLLMLLPPLLLLLVSAATLTPRCPRGQSGHAGWRWEGIDRGLRVGTQRG